MTKKIFVREILEEYPTVDTWVFVIGIFGGVYS